LYGCERIIANIVLRRIFGPKKEKVTGRQRNLHNEKFHDYVKGDEETRGTWHALE
jgi:hypothetical protein